MSTQDEPVLLSGASVFRMAGWRIASRNLAVVLAAIVVVMVAVRAAVATMAAVREHHYRILCEVITDLHSITMLNLRHLPSGIGSV